MAAQFTVMNAPRDRGLAAWSEWAISSLPGPVSPKMSTGRSVWEYFRARAFRSSMAGHWLTMSLKV